MVQKLSLRCANVIMEKEPTLDVFVMRCCPIFLDFLLVLTITLTRFSLIPVMDDSAVDMS